MKKLAINAINKAINRYLQLDPESNTRLEKLQGKIITIELLPLHFIFQCEFTEKGVNVHTDELLSADTKIIGTPLQMMNVMMTNDNRQQFFADDIQMTGSAEIGQQVIQLFDELDIDWEEQMATFTGDVPAHQLGRVIRGIKNWFKTTDETITDNINEYIHEEKEWLPTRETIQDFFSDIDTLRMDVDRMEAKINHLDEE